MPERVDRPTIRREVFKKLNAVAEPTPRLDPAPPDDPDNDPEEKKSLLNDLGMGTTFRRAMALPYTKISLRYKGKPVTLSDAQDLETVGDSVDLVHKQANA